jgi:hypothetical protein
MEQADGAEASQKTDENRQNDEPPVVFLGDAVDDPEHILRPPRSGDLRNPTFSSS